jgi:hypothetical protein
MDRATNNSENRRSVNLQLLQRSEYGAAGDWQHRPCVDNVLADARIVCAHLPAVSTGFNRN